MSVRTIAHCAADTESVAAIQHGKLLIQAKLGELMPAKSREESGAMKRKGGSPTELPFAKATVATYRKVAEHGELLPAGKGGRGEGNFACHPGEVCKGTDDSYCRSSATFYRRLPQGVRARGCVPYLSYQSSLTND